MATKQLPVQATARSRTAGKPGKGTGFQLVPVVERITSGVTAVLSKPTATRADPFQATAMRSSVVSLSWVVQATPSGDVLTRPCEPTPTNWVPVQTTSLKLRVPGASVVQLKRSVERATPS